MTTIKVGKTYTIKPGGSGYWSYIWNKKAVVKKIVDEKRVIIELEEGGLPIVIYKNKLT
jgi:hypothetical protein